MVWALFLVAAALVLIAGRQLTQTCNQLSLQTNLGHMWLGAILLATITSLPELSSTLSAAAIAKSADLAMGNVFGSNLINVTIIAMLWLLFAFPKKHSLSGMRMGLAAIFLSILTSLAIFWREATIPLLNLHPLSFMLLALFFWGLTSNFLHEDEQEESQQEGQTESDATGTSLRKTITRLIVQSLVIVASGITLSLTCDHIATELGLTKTFAGTLLLGVVTSLPELAVTGSAVAAGFATMATGNIFGSSCFNIGILALTDLVYRAGSIYAKADLVHLFQINSSILATLLALAIYYSNKKTKLHKMIAFSIILIYLLSLWIIFKDTAVLGSIHSSSS